MKRPMPWSLYGLTFLNWIALAVIMWVLVLIVSTIMGAVISTEFNHAAEILGEIK